MTSDEPRFSAEDVIAVASRLTLEAGTFLVGGQATNLWHWYYARDRDDAVSEEALTSKDIDYYGSFEAAKALAAAIGGEAIKPPSDQMNSPNTAVVIGELDGKPIRIDFLHGILGLGKKDLENGISVLRIPTLSHGSQTFVEIALLHPVACLRSRIANMLSPATLRRDRFAVNQLNAIVWAVGEHISDALKDGDTREATVCLRSLFQYGRNDPYGKRAFQDLGVDIPAMMTRFLTDERLDGRYRKKTLRPMIEKLTDRNDALARRTGPKTETRSEEPTRYGRTPI